MLITCQLYGNYMFNDQLIVTEPFCYLFVKRTLSRLSRILVET